MKVAVRVLSTLLILSMLAACAAPVAAPTGAPAPDGAKIVLRALFMQQAGYQQSDIEAITQEFEAQNPDVDVQLDFVAYEALHDKIITSAASGAGGYDVVLMDCIWPAEFASAEFILDVTDRISEDMKADIWPGALEAVQWQGRLYGMPWLNDVLYLYYNRAMLEQAGFTEPPKTWSELREMGMAAKNQGLVEYPFIEYFQQEEGLTIAFAYYLFAFGGAFFDEEGKPVFNSPEGLAALNFMVSGLQDGLINPASLESTYEEVRRTFSQGASLFSVNWAYQLNLANDPAESQIVGDAIVTLMPGEQETSATINGGMGLAIMKASQNPDKAWEYIQFLSSKDVQKRYAQNALPIWKSLFDDPALLEAQPAVAQEQDFVNVSKQQYAFLRNRPIVPYYSETSEIIAREVQAALTGAKTSEQALADAESEILKVREQYMQ
ncbi:MAG TPA: extracellular solute-binding protein [Chloroflexi bacterium]|nr:extracellular solute-binding protein [Chloroflexota bacterium]